MTGISIHAPLAGRDKDFAVRLVDKAKFQSTRPLRGATYAGDTYYYFAIGFQSTRPLRGATPAGKAKKAPLYISIHAPLAGRDQAGRAAGAV